MMEHRDLRLAVAATAICAVGSLITPLGEVRIVFAAPLTMFLPGYAIVAAVAGAQRPDLLRLLPLSVGISLSALVLGSLLLNYTPGGIRGGPWAILLVLVILGCCRIAAGRRPAPSGGVDAVRLKLSPATALLCAGCVVLSAAALILAQVTLPAGDAIGYTELWIAPPDQTGRLVRLGVTSEQQHVADYRLQIRIGVRKPPILRRLTLAPGETRIWSFDPGPSTHAIPVHAKLFRRERPNRIYRRVGAWIPASRGAAPR